MAISETKMQMVIANYFKDECDVNTSIKQAFEKGFRIGVKKGASTDRPQGEWIKHEHGFWTFVNDRGERDGWLPDYECNLCGSRAWRYATSFCPNCGARMKGADDEID